MPSPTSAPLKVTYAPLSEIQRWPRNPKKHKDALIRESIVEHGFVLPLVRDENSGRIVAGHGRLDELEAMKAEGLPPPRRILVRGGEWHVPVLSGVSFPDEATAEDYLLSDNRLVELGGWDVGTLLQFDHAALLSAGWTNSDIKRFVVEQQQMPEPEIEGISGGAIRQLVVYLPAAEFAQAVSRLEAIMALYKVENHTDAFLKMLEFYEAQA